MTHVPRDPVGHYLSHPNRKHIWNSLLYLWETITLKRTLTTKMPFLRQNKFAVYSRFPDHNDYLCSRSLWPGRQLLQVIRKWPVTHWDSRRSVHVITEHPYFLVVNTWLQQPVLVARTLRPALHLFNGAVRRARPTDYECIRTNLLRTKCVNNMYITTVRITTQTSWPRKTHQLSLTLPCQ
jgi:hypothetical protein